MLIAIGSDHGGFLIKEQIKKYLEQNKISYNDFGTNSEESVDYPVFARKVAQSVACGECELGILCCGTGIGVSIAANKIKGIRAALCNDEFCAEMARKHNNANVSIYYIYHSILTPKYIPTKINIKSHLFTNYIGHKLTPLPT